MLPGALTGHLDVVQILVALFFLFFAGLIYYLRREDKREGYPLWDISPRHVPIEGFPPVPPTKVYLLLEGGTTTMPHRFEPSATRAFPAESYFGSPLVPIGDAMLAEVGPGAYPMRKTEPLMSEGEPQVQPMRTAEGWDVMEGDADPRGMRVLDRAKQEVGTVVDLWVDRGVKILRYLEVKLDGDLSGRNVMVPLFRTNVREKRRVVIIEAMLAGHVRLAPRLANPDIITAREEDQVNAYFSAAYMYGRGHAGGSVPSEKDEQLVPRFPG
ncbi:MAG: photosynthetic reaction center subunit H [Acetobacteraceae bacterium]|nr:photosynthetic reaction center subunit H [Acetobacteraceae bacterium]